MSVFRNAASHRNAASQHSRALEIPTGTIPGPIPGFNFPLTSQLSIPPSVGGAQKRSLKSEKKGPPLKKHTIDNLENECLLQAIKGIAK